MQINKASLSNQIADKIRERIINVEIDQGEKINVSNLEDEFSVSRAPIREALQSLVDEGLVKVEPRVGYFAVQLSPKQVKDICELRKLLETFALTRSINEIPRSKLKELYQESLKLQRENIDGKALRARFDKIDEKIHSTIILNYSNEFLEDFIERIHNLIALTRHLNERIKEANNEHLKLIKKILERDEKGAKEKLQEHLDNVETEILRSYSNTEGIQSQKNL